MGKATKPRLNPRSKGGRPRQQGERTKSGRLKHSPNERDLLIGGLRAVRTSLNPPKGKPEPRPETPVSSATGRAQIERTVYVNEDGEPLLEVERVVRRPAA
ncbi:hypothetical protein ACWQV9_11165 [Brevundimonas diminuta]